MFMCAPLALVGLAIAGAVTAGVVGHSMGKSRNKSSLQGLLNDDQAPLEKEFSRLREDVDKASVVPAKAEAGETPTLKLQKKAKKTRTVATLRNPLNTSTASTSGGLNIPM